MVTDDEEVGDAATPLDSLTGKEKFQPEDALTTRHFASWTRPMFTGETLANDGVILDADDIADPVPIKPGKPSFANKLAVHREHLNRFRRHKSEENSHHCDALFGVGIATLGFGRKHFPNNRNGDFSNHNHNHNCNGNGNGNGNGKKIDIELSKLQIGAVHREDVSSPWLGNTAEFEMTDCGERESEVKEKN